MGNLCSRLHTTIPKWRGRAMAINRRTISRMVGRLLFSAFLFAALLGGPIIILIMLSRRFLQ